MRRATLVTALAFAVLTSACGSSADSYDIGVTGNASPATRLGIIETSRGRPVGIGILHALIVPGDLSTLYHEHPQEVGRGEFMLDVPALPMSEYDIWMERTMSGGHRDAILRRFTMTLKGGQPRGDRNDERRIALKPMSAELRAGKPSRLEFSLLLDGQLVRRYGKFVGIEVHSFAVSSDREFFVHDHATPVSNGVVKAHFTFPRAGDYVVFLQPTVLTEDGKELRTVLRHAVTIPKDVRP